jgi:putative ABC transport system substrate-binding protein
MVRRRDVIAGLLVVAGMRTAWAQEAGRIYRLGLVVQLPRERYDALIDELGRNGFVEGKNLLVDARGFSTPVAGLDATARAVVKAGPDAIYCGGEVACRAVQRATRTIPTATLTGDLLRAGLVASLARPGGNITGVSIFCAELDGKRLEILVEIVPGIRRMAVLADPGTATPDQLGTMVDAARSHGIELSLHRAATVEEIAPAIDAAQVARAQAINVLGSSLFNAHRTAIIEQVARAHLPAMYESPDYVKDGALACYGARQDSMLRQVARQLARLFAGIKPDDIPVQQPTQFALTINVKTAKALGLTIPPALLARADEVIE